MSALSSSHFAQEESQTANRRASPQFLLVLALALLSAGLLTMTSASVGIAEDQYGDAFYHFKRQGIFMIMGLFAMAVTVNIPVKVWRSASPYLLLLSFLLLILVLIPGVGTVVNGSSRWLDLGLFRLQPSELAKVFVVMYLAAYLERHRLEVQQRWSGFLKPLLVIGVMVLLLELEPDHGALVIMMMTAFCMIFLAGAKLYRFVLMLAPCLIGVYYVALTQPHVVQRFTSFLNPWADEYVYSSGYQLTQALIAFGRGEWFGLGLGNSVQKLHFLPEAHNDFVLAIIGEEFGLLGVMVVVLLFCLLVGKAFLIAHQAQAANRVFAAFVAYGLALLFAGQALINIGVNIQLLPTKGLTLPFFSYGGASLIVSCTMLALLMRIQFETDSAYDAESLSGKSDKSDSEITEHSSFRGLL